MEESKGSLGDARENQLGSQVASGLRQSNDKKVFTNDELTLLSTPSEELQKLAQAFCFSQAKFESCLKTTEPSFLVLQVHLYFDHVITRILTDDLKRPDAINARRMGFAQKLQLVEAMGLLPQSLLAPIEAINGIRNKFAHNLEFVVTEEDIRDLSNCTPKELRDVVLQSESRAPEPLNLAELCEVVLYQTELVRQQLVFDRVSGRKAELRLRSVLRRDPRVKYVP